VIVHAVSAATAVDVNPATGYVPSDRTQTDIPVTINKHKHHTYQVTVQEASSSRVNLIENFALTSAYSLGSAMVADLCALILNAAFANKTTKALGAGLDGFDRKQAILIGAALSGRGAAPFGRFMLLNSAYYASLKMDQSMLIAMLQAGSQAVLSGVLPNVEGFDVSEFAALPENAENLVGFAGVNTSLAIATRLPDDPG
jgi:hypothetical protein